MKHPKLYYCPGHMSFASHVILTEIGKPFEAITVSVKDGATQSPEFKRINPKGKIPVLDTGSEILTESAAILYYLALTNPECRLVPDSAMGVSRAIEWTNWLSTILAGPVGQHVRPERFTNEEHARPGVKEKGTENLLIAYAEINDRLAGQEWALGDCYSIVDPTLLIFFKWGNQLKLDMSQFGHWCEHAKRMERRPAVQAALAAENISIW
ncbi:glutathione S-transferase family protein [Paraburkholderia nemoris]|jgi:Glutathione S-transferase|uniref:Glutathione S-transferase GST-6.0 n=1 Tax=Paraburkholderia nemoris TaxID=2793076 RepID=A0ABN7M171_9BURK|nr:MULTISPECIES: glutathione S-transferase N-terminal domain-containing protein [Paraburkholderia]KPD19930.1 glutathione S-transferase [Burkholderia sp. ST111]MBK5147629.1 glutathione S-transferase N-terminal domain-containing protein [Burkholderia sp. R-69608]MBK3739552.1 glutathione S-transferase [Paraburkholderia aspalathi]MBK3782531.1 glutathione S-transferase [Paraburkholderia aspalathi]MBK3812272.1 glutathione S-transferase [Paraburkholderia aspalathi]